MCAQLSQENAALREQVERLSSSPVGQVALGGHPSSEADRAKLRVAGPASPLAAPTGRGETGGAGKVSRRMVGRSLGVAAAAALGTGALLDATVISWRRARTRT